MSEKDLKADGGVSAVKRIRERDTLKKQRLTLILIAAVTVLLIIALFVVWYIVDIYTYNDVDGTLYYVKKSDGVYALYNKNGEMCEKNSDGRYVTALGTLVDVDAESGECKEYAVVHTEGTEVRGYGSLVLMFKQLTYDKSSTSDMSAVIRSIEIHNEYGSYTLERDENGDFVIKGHADTPYSKESFAQLAVACGYTLSSRRLETPKKLADGTIDYAEYGLAPQARTRTETDKDGNETEITYEYEPAWYIITTETGESHKVFIGDMTVTKTGYYARYDGRDTIYVLGTSGITDFVLGRVEDIVTPTIVYPMRDTDYFNVRDFVIYKDIDYSSIYKELYEKYGELADSDEFYDDYQELFEKYSKKVCDFSYIQLEEREGTLNEHSPYLSKLEYARGYYINGGSIDELTYSMHSPDFTRVVKLSPTDDELQMHGLYNAAYVVGFLYRTTDDNGETVYYENFVEISEKSEDGVYYAYSSTYDMIVEISEESFEFLEWDDTLWYDPSYIQANISYVDKIIIESSGGKYEFSIDDSASKYMTYVEQSGSSLTVGEKKYSVVKNKTTGQYYLSYNGSAINPIYTGDYLLTPIVYSKGQAEAENYLFSEVVEVDADSDGTNDSVLYYFYKVGYNSKEYSLVAQVVYTDFNGNRLGDDTTVWGQSAMSSEYFVTKSGYLYFTAKNSHVGKELEENYGKLGRGTWGSGNLFVTANGSYILVDAESGEWSKISDPAQGIYFADKYSSRLAQRAVEIPARYDESGKLTRYAETYYPKTDKKIQYNEDYDKIMAYNKTSKQWENITYGDCTIGVWGYGSYYALEDGKIVAVNESTGDWGFITVSANASYIADVFLNGKLLDYEIPTTSQSGSSKTSTAMENFQQFYKSMLFGSFEGLADISDDEKEKFYTLDDFSSERADNPCQLKITVLMRDFCGNERNVVYRFYQYSERRSFITIEFLESTDLSCSSPSNAYGSFYVLRSFVDKIIADAERVVEAQEVVATSKY